MRELSDELLRGVIACVEDAGDMLAAEFYRRPRPRGHGHKADIDLEIELMLRERLLGLLHCRFVGEEAGTAGAESRDLCWVVDPHDGTSAFLKGHRGSAVSVGLLRDAVPVLGVVYSPLSPDRGPDLIAWMTGLDHLLRNGEPVQVDLRTRTLEADEIGSKRSETRQMLSTLPMRRNVVSRSWLGRCLFGSRRC